MFNAVLSRTLTIFIVISIQPIFAENQCKQEPLFATKILAGDNKALEATADKTDFKDKDNYNLAGNAEIYASKYYLGADYINIIKSKKTINAKGAVKIQADNLFITANYANIQKNGENIIIDAENINYQHKIIGINGVAGNINVKNGSHILINSSFSFCPKNNKKWQIKANKIILNTNKNIGYAENVKLEFFGIPFFYFPYYEWVLKGRESGILFPTISSYSVNKGKDKGYQLELPYYFNIAPEKDFTLTLKNISSHGQAINGLYRHLLAKNKKDGYFESEFELLKNDKQNKLDRWMLNNKYQQKIGINTKLYIETHRVSDKYYIEDIIHSNSTESIDSNIKLSYEKNNLSVYIFGENEQLINDGEAQYTRNLELFAKKTFNYNKINFAIYGVKTKFKHKNNNKIIGNRDYINFNTYREFKNLAYSLKPHLGITTSNYNLKDSQNKKYNSYTTGIDYKLFLERNTIILSKDIIHTLTPRVSYLYTPDKNQNKLPNFDSSRKSISYDSLFSYNQWIGLDRVSSANNITLGLNSEFIDNKNGNTYTNLSIARSYNIKTKNKSGIIASADFSYNRWKLNNAWQYDNKLITKDTLFSYQKNGINFINIGYHLTSDNKKSASISGSIPISGKSHIFTSKNYSITDKMTNYQNLGFMYDSCCIAFRIAYFKENIEDRFNKTIKFELIFKGLGNSSGKLREKITRDIPNYLSEL